MKYTSAEANKVLKQLREEEARLIDTESQNNHFNASSGEDIELVRPEYDLMDTQKKLISVREKIRKVKHEINCFNVTTEVANGMTIDQVLMCLPQLNERAAKLRSMSMMPKVKRDRGYGMSGLIDYSYANFDPEVARTLYESASEMIDDLQLKLDKVNNTVEFDVEI